MKEKCETCNTQMLEKDGKFICLVCNPIKHEKPKNACKECGTEPVWDGFLKRFLCGCDIIII